MTEADLTAHDAAKAAAAKILEQSTPAVKGIHEVPRAMCEHMDDWEATCILGAAVGGIAMDTIAKWGTMSVKQKCRKLLLMVHPDHAHTRGDDPELSKAAFQRLKTAIDFFTEKELEGELG